MEIECSILDVELLPPPPGVNALLAYISLSDFKQADPSGSAVYCIRQFQNKKKVPTLSIGTSCKSVNICPAKKWAVIRRSLRYARE
jgi:hypothetical protein